MRPPPARILVSCGDASGDLYLSELLRELRARLQDLEAFGLAGERSREAGAELLVSLHEVSVIGLVEVARKLPALKRAMSRLVGAAREKRPSAAVLVDFSGFNLRLARRLKAEGVPIIYYVSPQVWAWRRGRIRAIRETVDEMLVILPFEEAFYDKEGVRARYVGHPLVDLVKASPDRATFCRDLGLDPERPLMAILPGSRRREVELHLPVLREVVERLAASGRDVQIVVSQARTVPLGMVRDGLAEAVDRVRLFTGEVRDALVHARAAIVASGTATVEAALAETPMVVVYRVGRASYWLGKPFVRLPHYSMVNLIAGRSLVPELVQDDMTADAIEREVIRLLDDGEAREAMKRGLRDVRSKLGGGGASSRAADAVCSFLQKRKTAGA